MLTNLVSTLGRWVSWRQPADDVAHVEDERRIWVRYPCTLETTCLAVNGPDSVRLSALVRNISRGGIGLVVNREIAMGTFLSVELPSASEEMSSSVLAYVLRVTRLANGEWALGCSFATELSDEDLQPLGAKRVPASAQDKRAWARFRCDMPATCQGIRSHEGDPWPARLIDISASGGGLLVQRPIHLGSLLSLELRRAAEQPALTILASVVRVTTQPESEWILGCNFLRELSDKELAALV